MNDPPLPTLAEMRAEREALIASIVNAAFEAFEADMHARLIQLRRDLFPSVDSHANTEQGHFPVDDLHLRG
jgi:hypothetical protein